MKTNSPGDTTENKKEISCRVTRTLLMYVRENNNGVLSDLLKDLDFDEAYLCDTNNWVSHATLQILYQRMITLLGDERAVYKMALASERFQSMGLLDRIARLIGNPKLIYSQGPKYNKLLKLNGSVFIHEIGDNWVLLEDRYHDRAQKTRYDCDYARGIIAGIPTMFGLPIADVEEIECQVDPGRYGIRIWPDNPIHGHRGCLYRVTWTSGKKIMFLKRFFLRRHHYRQAIEDLQQANQLIQSRYDEARRLAADLEQANILLRESKKQLEAQKAELIASESRYRLLSEHATDIIWILNLETMRFDYISPSVKRIKGYTPQEAMALGLEQTLSPESLSKVTKTLEEELELEERGELDQRRSRTIEIQELIKTGGYIWTEAIVSFIRDDKGKPIAVMGITRDIAERKNAEAAIEESEKKYRDLFRHGSDLLCIHDLEGNLLETNLQYKGQYGWNKEDLEGVNIRELIPDRYKHLFDEYIGRMLKNGKDEGYLTGFTKEGREVTLEYRNTLIYDDQGIPKVVHGAARDVTERILAEKALRESEEKYRELVQYSPAGIYEFDVEKMRFIGVNDVMCEYTGYTEAEFLALDPFDLIADGYKDVLTNLVQEVLEGQQNPRPVEYKIKGKNNREFMVMVDSKFFFENGIPKRAMGVVHDLTEIRQAQEEKRKLEIQLQNAQRIDALGTLAGGVAHDFNNLLMGIQGNVSLLLLDLAASQEHREKLKHIQEYVQRGSELTRQLLGLARGGKYEVKPTNLNELVKSSAKMFGRTRKEISIHFKLQKDLWTVEVDRGQIEQVLLNLYINAWQAMPHEGDLYLETSNAIIDHKQVEAYQLPPGRYVQVSVTDTGSGMDMETQQKVFDPFFTTKERGRGTGLGLSSSYGIIKNHDGFIEVDSEPGYGCTFTIHLPASDKEAEIIEPQDNGIRVGSGRILLVDDEDMIIEVGKHILERLGYEVITAKSGREALDIFKKQLKEIDLVVLDMIMPETSGSDTFDHLKAINPEVKVLLSSGYSITGQAADILKRGCNGFIQKPFNINELSIKIGEILAE